MRESTRQRLTRRIKSAMHSRSRLLTCATADEIRRVLPDFEELFGDATRKTSVVARNVLTLLVIGGGQGLCTPLCAVYSAWLQPAWKLWRRSTMFNMLPNYSEDSARLGNQHHSHFLTLLMINFNFDAHRGADCAL